jgi:hypothetical protein
VIFGVILPWLGVLVYLIAQHDGMRERSVQQGQAQKREFDTYSSERGVSRRGAVRARALGSCVTALLGDLRLVGADEVKLLGL